MLRAFNWTVFVDQDRLPYISYMLRLWMENDRGFEHAIRGQAEWRVSLEDPHSQQMQVFVDLEALFDFLLRETERLVADENVRSEADDMS